MGGEGLAVREEGAPSFGSIRGPCTYGHPGRTDLHLLVAVLASPQMPCEWHTRREGPAVAVRSGRPTPMALGRMGSRKRPMVLAVRVGCGRVGYPNGGDVCCVNVIAVTWGCARPGRGVKRLGSVV